MTAKLESGAQQPTQHDSFVKVTDEQKKEIAKVPVRSR
jgi:hypothetical protein